MMSLPKFERRDDAVGRKNGVYYNTPEGIRLPSVSKALSEFYPEKKVSLEEWRKRIGYEEADRISNVARNRGHQLHDLLEKYLIKSTDVGKITPTCFELFKQVKPIIDDNVGEVFLQEAPLWSHKYNLAGRIDLLTNWSSVLSTVDFKNSIKPKRLEWIQDYFLQTTAYSLMIEEVYGVKVTQNVILIAVVEDPSPQVFINNPQEMKNHEFFTSRLS